MGDLTNEQGAMFLGCSCHLLERFKTLAKETGFAGDDSVSSRFKVIVINQDIAREDETDPALTKGFV
jgi:hypothetical protein